MDEINNLYVVAEFEFNDEGEKKTTKVILFSDFNEAVEHTNTAVSSELYVVTNMLKLI